MGFVARRAGHRRSRIIHNPTVSQAYNIISKLPDHSFIRGMTFFKHHPTLPCGLHFPNPDLFPTSSSCKVVR